MLRESGRVVALETEAVWVETLRSSACGRCTARAGCGHGALGGALAGRKKGLIRVIGSDVVSVNDCRVDDTVDIELPESAVLRASALLYGLPLLVGVGAAIALAPAGELPSLLGFAFGLGTGFWVARTLGRRAANQVLFEPRLVRRHVVSDDLIASTAVL